MVCHTLVLKNKLSFNGKTHSPKRVPPMPLLSVLNTRSLFSGVCLVAKRAANERIVVEFRKSGRKLKASREGSKRRNCGT